MRREEFGLENLVKALNHMKGTLLICDRNRNVVYYNDVVCSALDIPEERLSGANLMGLAEEGYILNSASIQAFETRQLSIKYVRGKMKMPILTVSNPVLDENGEVALVVAVSFNEQITELVAREMMESRQKSIEGHLGLSDPDLPRRQQHPADGGDGRRQGGACQIHPQPELA